MSGVRQPHESDRKRPVIMQPARRLDLPKPVNDNKATLSWRLRRLLGLVLLVALVAGTVWLLA